MKKLLVYLDEDFHADLKELAHRKRTSMGALVRYALDKTFEDELDAIAGEAALDEYLRDPASGISLDDYLKERGIVRAGRTLSRLPAGQAERILPAILALGEERFPRGAVKLTGAAPPLWRIRVGEYRVVYSDSSESEMVIVEQVVRRSSQSYERLP